jgi:GNAT superfamily N-acetyltransferase
MSTEAGQIRILRWTEIENPDRIAGGLDAVFFSSSATQSFPDEAARIAFRERWLGRYLRHFPNWAYAAIGDGGQVCGYLVGSLDDPARTPLFDDIGYFKTLAHLTARFPAQLHVNVEAAHRGRGLGSRLVERFVRDAAEAGAPGIHVMTARGMRNIGFYLGNRFHEEGAVEWSGRELVFLARPLSPSTP